MTRILTPVPGGSVGCLGQICARYFREVRGLRIAEYDLGNPFTGRIDLLATDQARTYLVTIGADEFSRCLLRAFMGYRWFLENRDFLARVYGPGEIDVSLPPSLVILAQDVPVGAGTVCSQVCSIPVELYRYRLFGSQDDPDISVEELDGTGEDSLRPDSTADLIRELGIGCAGLTEEEVRDFRTAMGFS